MAITSDLNAFSQSSWVVTAYLLTFAGDDLLDFSNISKEINSPNLWAGFMIVLAKLSDIFGRKALMCFSLLTFVVFSGACGAAQTIIQLWVVSLC